MVAGLKFLSKKGFNPQNTTNQKRVWEAEQVKKEQLNKASERDRQLQRERDDEELARSRGEIPKLSFLYAVPPGLESNRNPQKDWKDATSAITATSNNNNNTNTNIINNNSFQIVTGATNSFIERQPGDDDAAAAFRRALAASMTVKDTVVVKDSNDRQSKDTDGTSHKISFGTVMQGTDYDPMAAAAAATTANKSLGMVSNNQQSTLEKAVGRRYDGNLSLEEQIQRFPALANAPRAKGMTATDIGVSFKPLGTQIRNVRCLACGIWGHSRGDRECLKSGWDPFAKRTGEASTSLSLPVAAKSHMDDGECRPRKRNHGMDEKEEDIQRRKTNHKKKKHHKRYHRDDEDNDNDTSSERSSKNASSESSHERRHRRRHRKKDKRHHKK